jgi:hypothetical protein
MLDAGECETEEVAVLFRAHRQARAVEQELVSGETLAFKANSNEINHTRTTATPFPPPPSPAK